MNNFLIICEWTRVFYFSFFMTYMTKKLIVCDWNRTLYNPESQKLYDDASSFLESLGSHTLILVSALEASTGDSFKENKIDKFFQETFIGKEKNSALFADLRKQYPDLEPWVIGDRITSEITLGNENGFKTIRILRGKFREQNPENEMQKPQYTVETLRQALILLSS